MKAPNWKRATLIGLTLGLLLTNALNYHMLKIAVAQRDFAVQVILMQRDMTMVIFEELLDCKEGFPDVE